MDAESRLSTQFRVFFALVMREMTTRYGRSAGGYLWAVLEPAGAVALLSAVFAQIARLPPLGDSFPMYFATGYLAFHVYVDISRAVSASLKVNKALLGFPRVTMLDTVMARFALQLLTVIVVFVAIIGGFIVVLEPQVSLDLRDVLLALALAALLGLGVGAMNCVLFAFSPTWERVFGIVNRPLMLISGVFYNFESLPREIQAILWWNPLIHVTALMRRGFYDAYEPSFLSPAFAFFAGLLATLAGVVLIRALRARLLEL